MPNRLEVSHAFCAIECDLYRAGGAVGFCCYLSKILTFELDENGGIRPYVFWCVPPGDGPLAYYTMFASEL